MIEKGKEKEKETARGQNEGDVCGKAWSHGGRVGNEEGSVQACLT